MDALAGYGSDDSSSSDSPVVTQHQPQESKPTGTPPTIQDPPSTKRARIEISHTLKPKTSSTSVCRWPVNYLQKPIAPRLQVGSLEHPPTMQQMQASLQRVSANVTPSTSWADHLRSQHDFHNPHFFASVVEHFGIQDMMGTCSSLISEDETPDFVAYQQGLFPKVTEESTTTTT